MRISAVVIVLAGVYLSLLPNEQITSLKKQWEPATWALMMSNNHDHISRCYGFLEDKNYAGFLGICDVTELIITENLIHSSLAQARTKYPYMTRRQFLLKHFDLKTTIVISSHLNIYEEFRMTLMILMIAEPLVPLYV